jgi:hypothetical protein
VLAEDGAEALADLGLEDLGLEDLGLEDLGLEDLGLATSRRSRDARPRPKPYTGVFAG